MDNVRVLFIADKWCAGNKKFGLSEWENNLYNSFKSSNIGNSRTVHFDEYYEINKETADECIKSVITEYKPTVIFIIIYKIPGSDVNVPKLSTFEWIQNVAKIPMVAIWGDLEMEEQVLISKILKPFVNFNIATASSSAVKRINDRKKYGYMWVPKDSNYFNDPNLNRDIDINYTGSPKINRLKIIDYLKNNGIKVECGGGERQEHKSVEKYAETYKRSKITLSFSRANLSQVVNARPFEAMLCGSMVLEQEGFELMKLYIPYVDYVPYKNKKDLLNKVKYYLKNEEERKIIANNGKKKTEKVFSAQKFWNIAIKSAADSSAVHSSIEFNNIMKLDLPIIQKIKLQTINVVSDSSFLFFFYKLFHVEYYKEIIIKIASSSKPFLIKCLPENILKYIIILKRKIL